MTDESLDNIFDTFSIEKEEKIPDSILEQAELLKTTLRNRATHCNASNHTYVELRRRLLAHPTARALLPTWINSHRSLDEFWGFMREKFTTYQERREFLRNEFDPLLTAFEGNSAIPSDLGVVEVLATAFDSDHVHLAWERALERRDIDPEGAITAARSLLESTCKHILSELGCDADQEHDLQKLYTRTAAELNLSPSQHTEEAFRRILGGGCTIVNGLATLRNKLSDSHGQGPKAVRPASRHAKLAVNVAGTLAMFLVETFEYVQQSTKEAQL